MEKKRLESLDILRGFDLWVLLFFGTIVHAYCKVTDKNAFVTFLETQCEHPEWNGFVAWDMIMPLFIFMSGITIPFSMSLYRKEKRPDMFFWKKLLKRFCLLFLLGWIVQGHLLDLDFKLFNPFANTLQAIAVAYVIAAITYVYGGIRLTIVTAIICSLTYFLLFALNGQLYADTQDNIAMWVDKAILGSHRDGIDWADDGTWSFKESYRYTWIISSLNFAVTGIMGCLTGHLLRLEKFTPQKRTLYLLLISAILIVFALAMAQFMPINKKRWNTPMTILSGGICCSLMAFTYYIVDVKGWRKGLNWLKYYGMNSIFAYVVGSIVSFSSISKAFFHGFEPILNGHYDLLIKTSNAILLLLLLRHLYNNKKFFKV